MGIDCWVMAYVSNMIFQSGINVEMLENVCLPGAIFLFLSSHFTSFQNTFWHSENAYIWSCSHSCRAYAIRYYHALFLEYYVFFLSGIHNPNILRLSLPFITEAILWIYNRIQWKPISLGHLNISMVTWVTGIHVYHGMEEQAEGEKESEGENGSEEESHGRG